MNLDMRPFIVLLLVFTARAFAVQSVALFDAGTPGNPPVAPSPAVAALPWTAGAPTSDTGNFSSVAVSPDGATGFNAWRTLDNSTAASQFITWTRALTTQQHTDAAAYGWKMTARIRVADPVAANGGSNSTVLLYGNNSTGGTAKRWILFFDINAAGEIVTTLVGGATVTLTGVDASQHHVHELRYNATTAQAEYFVDGVLKSSGYTGTGTNFNGVQWGTGSSGGRGDGYWNAVEFVINDPPAPPAPTVTTQPISQSVAPGANVSLTGGFSGTGITYQWYKNAAVIPAANAATLTLNNVSAAAAGDYWARATNASGMAETRTAALEIRGGAALVISEFLAENDHGLIDSDGEQHDWLELHNPTTATLSTAGLFLTDDALVPSKWALPAVNIAPGGFLTVFASEKNRAVAGAELHTNFKVSNAGGYLALTGAGGAVISAFTYPAQFSDISFGSTMNGAAKFFLIPSPAALNTDGITNVRPEPVFDISGGTFSGSRTVPISTAMTGGTLRFTTNGARPQFDSAAYTAPIALTASAHLRAAMIFPGERYGASSTASHLKLGADVTSFTSPLPVVILHNGGAGAVPGVSGRGPNGDGSDVVEVAMQGASLTILDEVGGNTAMTSPVVEASRSGLRVRGSSSFTFNRKSYALETWTELDEEPREKSLLGMSAESDWVLYAPDPSQFDLPLIHNSLIYELARQSGFDAPRFRFVEVFLNTGGGDITMADHRGLYLLVEKPKRANGRVNFNRLNADGTAGGWMLTVDRMDALPIGSTIGSLAPRHFHTAGPDGTVQTADDNVRGFQAIVNGVASGAGVLPANDDIPNFYHSFFNFDSPRGWEITAAQRGPIQTFVRAFDTALYGANYTDPTLGYAPFIDVQNWAHHLALHSFAKNQDAVVLSAYLKRETPTAKMKWATIWDFDRSYNRNTSNGGGAATLNLSWAHDRLFYPRLMTDAEFAQAYIDQWQNMRRGAFSTANMQAVLDAQVAEITSTVAARSGTTAGTWATNTATLRTWLGDRGAAFDAQFTAPAVFSQLGGNVPAGFSLSITAAAGDVYYTTNATDPRAVGGAATGTLYTGAIPITATTTVFARVKNGSAWSGTTVATFYPPQDLQTLRVTELYYNPPGAGAVDGDEFEFAELQNTGLVTLDLGGLSFSGITFTFPAGTSLAPGAYFLLARNPAQLATRFPGVVVNGTYTGKLDNNGETLALVQGAVVVWSFAYDDSGAWPTQADNGGMSLQRPDPAAPGYSAATFTAAAPTPGGALSLADSDGDGMPDYFETLHALSDPNGDADGDGATNSAEFNAGTNPRNNLSVFKLTASATTDAATLALQFQALGGRSYSVQYRDELTSGVWEKYYDVPAGPDTRDELITVPMNTAKRFFRIITPVVAGAALLMPASGGDNVALDPIFSDHMVLQRDAKLPVWGTAAAGHEITVTFNGTAAAAVADAQGRWLVELPAQAASKTSRELKVLAGGQPRLTVADVLVGEVWLCAGQSNMEWRTDQEATWASEQASAALPHVRLRNMGYAGQGIFASQYSAAIVARQTAADFYNASAWAACDATNAAPFSAVGYFFGKEIRNALDVPVGLINMSVGGSPAEAWMRRAIIPAALTTPGWTTNDTNLEPWCNGRALVQLGTLIGTAPGDDMGPNHSFKPAFIWNAGPARLAPFAIRGVLWYQGESNALSHIGEPGVTNPKWRVDQHETLFPLLVSDWRAQWGQGNFPFLVCQLSSISETGYDSDFWPEFRDYQRRATAGLPNMGLAVTSDIGNASNVHPTNKRDVGKRLARWAQKYVHGDSAVLACPLPSSATRSGSTVTVSFNDAGPALSTSNAAAPATFEVAGADGVFYPATASIVGATVTATSASVATPTRVRYAWQPFSGGNLVNSAGFPASTFSLNIAP
jgi:sialate O-acetylesterase